MAHERSTEQTWAENPNQAKYDQEYYKHIIPWISGDVLDIGCGVGMFIRDYCHKAKKIYAIDKCPISERLRLPGVAYAEQDINLGVTVPKKVDCVVSTEFIEHINKEEFLGLLIDIKKSLKKTGNFVGSTPNKVEATTNPYHLYEYTMDELAEILRANFKEVEIFDNGQNCTVWNAKYPL